MEVQHIFSFVISVWFLWMVVCFPFAMFVTVPFIFLILGVPKILKWLDDCNHVKIYFLEVCFVKLLLKCGIVYANCYPRFAGTFTYSSRENLSASMEVDSLNPNSGSEFPGSGEEAWIGNCSWAFALRSISNQREWVALGTGHQQRLSHVQKEFKKELPAFRNQILLILHLHCSICLAGEL